MNQEMRDWKNHPITANFYAALEEALEFYNESMANIDASFDERELARQVGVKQGLEALLHYDPDFDENGVIIKDA